MMLIHEGYSKNIWLGAILLCLLISLILGFCFLMPRGRVPTDVPQTSSQAGRATDASRADYELCTRVEMRFDPPPLRYLCFGYDAESLFTPAELKYLRSLEVITLTETEDIKALARGVGPVLYVVSGPVRLNPPPMVSMRHGVLIDWYGADKGWVSTIWRGDPNSDAALFVPALRSFWLRARCAEGIASLGFRVPSHHTGRIYPPATDWCDAVLAHCKAQGYGDKEIRRIKGCFRCQAARDGDCHYAMNPNCEPNSPPGTVLLFETKAGWNQHGGPELFTFDNHDPKGGCVLLNDGTVKFIRTKEELAQLRWKP